jgi:DUF1680 family protein
MNLLGIDGKYADLIERILYNGFLSSTSLDGKSFFYENPLEVCRKEKDKQTAVRPELRTVLPIWKRKEVFNCSCCPPNINRFVASLGGLIYTQTEALFLMLIQKPLKTMAVLVRYLTIRC